MMMLDGDGSDCHSCNPVIQMCIKVDPDKTPSKFRAQTISSSAVEGPSSGNSCFIKIQKGN